MSIQNCGDPEAKEVIIPKKRSDCTFTTIEEWDEEEHAHSCNTMFIMSDGSGAYIWNQIEEKWDFLEFSSEGEFPDIPTIQFQQSESTPRKANKVIFQTQNVKYKPKGVIHVYIPNGGISEHKTINIGDVVKDDFNDLVVRVKTLEETPKQIRTTIGISDIPDSDIFNADVIEKADLLWTKDELPEGNLVTVIGEFKIKETQASSYENIFWTTPKGFELFDTQVLRGQFVSIMQYTPLTNASLNALQEVDGILGWSNYGSISANYFTINVKLRAE